MHIPDGYLSPQTCAAAYAVAVPTMALASRKVGATLGTRNVPALAMFAAVTFLVMMFNIPIPDGTTAHAVGAGVVAIVLGPYAAVVAVSVALLLQALLFGDGGVLAYGANVLDMAILMPFVAVGVYRLVAGNAALTSRRRVVAAGLGGYAGINAAGLATGVLLGIQPVLFHDAAGTPLYSPYHLSQTLPAMAVAHLTVAGAAEAILTAAVFAYLVKTDPRRLAATHARLLAGSAVAAAAALAPPRRISPTRVAVLAVLGMALLTPLGLLAPGGAFGEQTPEELDLTQLGLGAVPAGLGRYAGFWSHAVLRGYGFAAGDNAVLAYWLSALVGIAVVGIAGYAAGWLIRRAGPRTRSEPAGRTPS